MKEEKEAEKIANIIFVGKYERFNAENNRYEIVPREAPGFVIECGKRFDLPPNICEGAFVEEDVKNLLLGLFPNDFKSFEPVKQFETDLPAEFPGREVLRSLEKNLTDIFGLTREELLQFPGIGEKTADKILIFLSEVNINGK